MASECPYCSNGRIFVPALRTWQPCPHCHGAIAEVKAGTIEKQSSDDKLRALKVPEEYLNKKFNPSNYIIDPAACRIYTEESIEETMQQLIAIEDDLKSNKKLGHSYYIYTSVMSDYMSFVHSCMRAVLSYNNTTKPFISLYDLSELRKNNPVLMQQYDSSYIDYTTCDICFLFASAGLTEKEDVISLADILTERGRRGLPTIVMGYWSKESVAMRKTGISFLLANSDVKPTYSRMEYVGFVSKKAVERKQTYTQQAGLTSFVAGITNSGGNKE